MSRIRPIFKGMTEEEKNRFKYSKCLLTISVGQQSHEAELFNMTVDLVNEHFGSCVLLVDDSLQRHTMALDSQNDANYFYNISVDEGDLWLQRNEKYYCKFSIPVEIIRWDKWLNHPNFREQQEKIRNLIRTDIDFRTAFDRSIEKFLKKFCERLSNPSSFDIKRAWQLSLDYLVEECAVLCLWTELKCNFEVYPSKRNQAMDMTHKTFVLPMYPDLLHAIEIKFRNAQQKKPQFFELLSVVNGKFYDGNKEYC